MVNSFLSGKALGEQSVLPLPARGGTSALAYRGRLQLPDHTFARAKQGFERHRIGGHADEVAFVVGADIAERREQYFMHRAVVAGQIDDEGAPDFQRDALMLEELHHVEQVARVLTI